MIHVVEVIHKAGMNDKIMLKRRNLVGATNIYEKKVLFLEALISCGGHKMSDCIFVLMNSSFALQLSMPVVDIHLHQSA